MTCGIKAKSDGVSNSEAPLGVIYHVLRLRVEVFLGGGAGVLKTGVRTTLHRHCAHYCQYAPLRSLGCSQILIDMNRLLYRRLGLDARLLRSP